MGIKLNKVELSNIRAHEHFVFKPGEEGITAIVGPNGSGKSTILDSIAWVIFGTKPAGVSKASAIYRDDATWGKDKCWGAVVMDIDGQEIKIVRRMTTKAGSVECNVYELTEKEEKHMAGPAVSHAENYLRKRLKMDESGFLTSILVQQKQVDSIILAKPKDRGEVIEKLTGISSLTEALNNARAESNEIKKELARFDVKDGELEALKDSLKSQEDMKENLLSKIHSLQESIVVQKNEYDNAKEKRESQEKIINESETYSSKLHSIEAQLEVKKESLGSLIVEKDEVKKKIPSGIVGDLQSIENEFQKYKNTHRDKENLLYQAKKELDSLNKQKIDFNKVVTKSSIKDLDEALSAKNKVGSKSEHLRYTVDRNRTKITSLKSEVNKIHKAIKVLTDGHGSCPTCLQKVSDVSNVVDVLEKEIKTINDSVDAICLENDRHQKSIEKNEDNLHKLEIIISSIEGLNNVDKEIFKFTSRVEYLESEVQSCMFELEAHEKIYQKSKNFESTNNEYRRLLSRVTQLSDNVESLLKQKNEINELMNSLQVPSKSVVERNRKHLEKVFSELSKNETLLEKFKGEKSLIEEKINYSEEKIAILEKVIEEHGRLVERSEISMNTTKVIERFREDRIENSVPVIEAYASDLISRFTEGKFTRMLLDKKFNTTVVLADGTHRAIGLLSGGELSAAAISLRIAISVLLNGNSTDNIIILDEVFVSQDSNRMERILSTIKEVCKGQIIIISHDDVAESISDKTVSL